MKDKINWCFSTKDVNMVEPNENLTKAYFFKANNAMKAMKDVKGNVEWEISAAYYAMYCSVYALFMKIGIKSEIHSCTIEIFKRYFSDHFSAEEFRSFENAKRLRESVQYYSFNVNRLKGYPQIIEDSEMFCLKCLSAVKDWDAMAIRRNLCNST